MGRGADLDGTLDTTIDAEIRAVAMGLFLTRGWSHSPESASQTFVPTDPHDALAMRGAGLVGLSSFGSLPGR